MLHEVRSYKERSLHPFLATCSSNYFIKSDAKFFIGQYCVYYCECEIPQLAYHKGLLTLKKYHGDSMGLHEFFLIQL